MVPDLEVPVLFLLGVPESRLVLHSLIGAVTFGAAISLALTVWIYPALVSAVFPIDKVKVKEKCRFSLSLVFCCLIGGLSHVLLDVANHAYNPLFWPFLSLNQTPSPIVPLLGGEDWASIIMHTLMVLLFVGLFFNKRQRFWERLLVE